MKNKVVKVFGFLLMVVSLAFLIRRMLLLAIKPNEILTIQNLAFLVILPIFSVLAIFINSYCWRSNLTVFTKTPIFAINTFPVYAKANIMKYLPGNVGHYVGRQFFGRSMGVDQLDLAVASFMEIAYSIGAVLLCALLFSAKESFSFLYDRFSVTYIVVIIVIIGLLLLGFLVLHRNVKVRRLMELMRQKAFWKALLTGLILMSGSVLIHAMGFVLIFSQYGPLSFEKIRLLLTANMVSLLVGFITPGVPGGIGVRETVLLSTLSSEFPENAILFSAIIHRLTMILGDLLAVPISSAIALRKNQ